MKELDCVKLIKPFEGINVGVEGTILIKYNDVDYEVEFVDENGDTIGVYTISKDFLELIWESSK